MEVFQAFQRSFSWDNIEVFTNFYVVLPALAFMILLETLFPWRRTGKKRFFHIGRHLILRFLNLFTTVSLIAIITNYLELRNYFGMGLFWKLDWPFWLKTLFGFVILDFWLYLTHQANHHIPLLWRFHKVHHTDNEIDASTASRFHPGQVILAILIDLPLISLIGFQPFQLLIFIIAFRIIEIFQHSNIRLPEKINSALALAVVTPTFHRIHHSQESVQTNSNFGVFFSFWDSIFNTKHSVTANAQKNIKFGLKEFSEEKWQTLSGILMTPYLPKTKNTTVPSRLSSLPDHQKLASTKSSITRFKFQAKKNGIESS